MPNPDQAPAIQKAVLRKAMRARLAAELHDRAGKSAAICAALARHPAYLQARTVALFDAMPSEPDLGLLWEMAARRFVYPRVDGEGLILIEVSDQADLIPSSSGLRYREPAHLPERVVEPAAIDLVITPGLAFTRTGLRLGRGGGYYDRLLAALSPHTVTLGVCFELQVVPEIPAEEHDIALDGAITELGGII
jgi:5-formyltetrahydrofolate cyclo-ligase